MNKITRYAILLSASLLSALAMAQTGSPYRIFDIRPDARSEAMGGMHLISESKQYIYANPTYIFDGDNRLAVHVSSQLLPKYEGVSRDLFGTIGVGYRINDRYAFFAGTRYLCGGKLTMTNEIGNELAKEIRTKQTTLDLGCAIAFRQNLRGYFTLSMIADHTRETNSGIFAGMGVAYTGRVSVGSLDAMADATLAAYNLGRMLKQDEEETYQNLPSTVALGGKMTSSIASMHSVSMGVQVGYVTAYSIFQAGIGAEYKYDDLAAVRLGLNHADKGVNYFTLGLGLDYSHIGIDAGYILGLNEYTKDIFAVGVTFQF